MGNWTKSDETLRPDPRYQSLLVAKLANNIMKMGKKATARQILYEAMGSIEGKIKDKNPVEVVETAINNVKPVLEVRSKRVGGATYQIPVEVPKKRQQSLSIRWILEATRKRKGRPMAQKLAEELVAAYNKEGEAIKKKEDVHKMAEANRAFAHFAW